MRINKVSISNFRGIENIKDVGLKELTILIGENGVAKTALLEAINFALSPSFLSDRLKHTDFFKGTDDSIEIELRFDENFTAHLPDGFAKQDIECNGVYLRAKKRDKAKSGKLFTELVVTQHMVLPNRPMDNDRGWELKRKSGSIFKFDGRLLAFPVQTTGFPKSFYFSKSREKQIKKGFRTSMETIISDFNWRFTRDIRKADPPSAIPDDKNKLESEIIGTIDKKLIKATFDSMNDKLTSFGIPAVQLKLLDSFAPFDNMFLSRVIKNVELQTSQIGSGIEILVSLVFLETLASNSNEQLIILIDEPELHLHPKLQKSLIPYFDSIISENQVICSTHSPYLYQDCVNRGDTELVACLKDDDENISFNSMTASNLFPWSPSWGEINFVAFNLPTVEFHNELYGRIQDSNSVFNTADTETFFVAQGILKNKQWVRLQNGTPLPPEDVTLMTYIRHKIHHPENISNADYSESELRESIETMVSLL